MAEFFLMPQASPTMESGRLLAWHKKEGDKLAPQDVIAEVETDKAAMEIEVFDPGYLLKILIPADSDVPVDTPIAIIGSDPDEDISDLLKKAQATKAAAPAPAPEAAPAPAPTPAPESTPAPVAVADRERLVDPPPGSGGVELYTWQGREVNSSVMEMPAGFSVPGPRKRSAPAARRLAAELGVDLDSVTGSGPHGRVLSEDVRRASERPARAPSVAVQSVSDESLPHTNMRKTIAKRMMQSYLGAPTFFLTVVFDCDALVSFRGQLKAAGVKVSYNDILMKATARALREVPAVNASWGDGAITRHGAVNIGMAVALDGGLIVPVIRDVDAKGLSQIASETRELAGRARELKLKPDEYQGSTFTISNLGMMGIEHFTAIINQPNSGILAVGGLQQEPVVVDGALTVGWRMRLTMTCDHRVIDGALGATFLQAIRKYIENPALLST